MSDELSVLSWNVNGLRSAGKKGFGEWLDRAKPSILGLQETRSTPEQLPEALRSPPGYHAHFAWGERLGYSGVGLLSREAPDEVVTSLDVPEFDVEGRFILARFGALVVVNAYFPNGNGKDRDNSRIPYKLAFYRHLMELLEPERAAGAPVLVMGDFNTAFAPIDLARPRQNEATSGFRPEERAELGVWFERGWVDTFRAAHPEEGGHYSWWSQRAGARGRNIGWRIDYVLASAGATPFVRRSFIQPEVLGSDHCPVGVALDPAVVAAP